MKEGKKRDTFGPRLKMTRKMGERTKSARPSACMNRRKAYACNLGPAPKANQPVIGGCVLGLNELGLIVRWEVGGWGSGI